MAPPAARKGKDKGKSEAPGAASLRGGARRRRIRLENLQREQKEHQQRAAGPGAGEGADAPRAGTGVVDLVAGGSAKDTSKKKRKREQRREALLANKLWRSFDRKSSHANRFFAEYYKLQLPELAGDAAFTAFNKSLSESLPVTFRLNRGRYPLVARALEERLADEFRFKGSFVRIGADRVLSSDEVVNPVSWARDVYQLGTDRIGFVKTAALAPLYETVEREARLGHAARQGVASMLPAIVLEPKPDDVILDMCAAPGSKSEQLLQMMGTKSQGVVVTNDPDPKRLSSVKRRFQTLAKRAHVITCSRGEDLSRALGPDCFDKVICDVPCTGDGTIRKFPYLWRCWRAKRAVMIHPLQLQIAMSAASLLKVGGRMIYSTCSINPIEDEAVVAALLKATNGALRLVSVELKGFITRPGIATWVADEALMREGAEDDSDGEGEDEEPTKSDEAPRSNAKKHKTDDAQVKPATKKKKVKKGKRAEIAAIKVLPTMLPPTAKEAKDMHLERCMRILPQDNNTEGFFVAVLEKCAPWEERAAAEATVKESGPMSASKARKLLSTVGFNPRVADESKFPLGKIEPLEWTPSLSEQAQVQLGVPASFVEDGLLRLHRVDEDHLEVFLVTKGVAAMLAEPWARKQLVPLLSAGVRVAHALCRIEADGRVAACGPLKLCAEGTMDLASALCLEAGPGNASEERQAVAEADKADMFALLQLAMSSLRARAEANEDASEETASASPAHLSIRQCVELLEGGLEDDEDDDDEASAELDPDLCQNVVAERMLRTPVGGIFMVGLSSDAFADELAAVEAARAAEAQAAMNRPKRMSVAERRRLKKAKKGKSGSKAAAQPGTQAGDSAATKVERQDMFNLSGQPPFGMVLTFQRVSPEILILVSDQDQISSFGQALQTVANAAGVELVSDDEDDEQELGGAESESEADLLDDHDDIDDADDDHSGLE